jgi:hypothetical protein
MLTVAKPSLSELNPYYSTYMKYVPEDDLLGALSKQQDVSRHFLEAIPEAKGSFAYADGKWMLKEVVGHVCDTERILSYRALRISRNDKTPMPGFDENHYTPNSNYNVRSLANIAAELKNIGLSSVSLFSNMSGEMFARKGLTNNMEVSVRDLLFFIVAHQRHHLDVIQKRYLS